MKPPHTKLIRQELQTIRGDGFVEQKKSTLDNNDDFLHCPTDGLPSVVG